MSNYRSYQPLAGQGDHSPSLQPYDSHVENDPEHLELNGYDSNGKLRAPSNDYTGYAYSNPPVDIESKGLISEPEYRVYKRRFIGLAELTRKCIDVSSSMCDLRGRWTTIRDIS